MVVYSWSFSSKGFRPLRLVQLHKSFCNILYTSTYAICISTIPPGSPSCHHFEILFFFSVSTTVLKSKGSNIIIQKETSSSWWFQPLWKICSSNWKSSSPRFGVKIKNIFELPPPSCVIHIYIYILHLLNIILTCPTKRRFERSFFFFRRPPQPVTATTATPPIWALQTQHRRPARRPSTTPTSWTWPVFFRGGCCLVCSVCFRIPDAPNVWIIYLIERWKMATWTKGNVGKYSHPMEHLGMFRCPSFFVFLSKSQLGGGFLLSSNIWCIYLKLSFQSCLLVKQVFFGFILMSGKKSD